MPLSVRLESELLFGSLRHWNVPPSPSPPVIAPKALREPGVRSARIMTPPLAHLLEPVPLLVTRAWITPSPSKALKTNVN
jgi:hypothetical protein